MASGPSNGRHQPRGSSCCNRARSAAGSSSDVSDRSSPDPAAPRADIPTVGARPESTPASLPAAALLLGGLPLGLPAGLGLIAPSCAIGTILATLRAFLGFDPAAAGAGRLPTSRGRRAEQAAHCVSLIVFSAKEHRMQVHMPARSAPFSSGLSSLTVTACMAAPSSPLEPLVPSAPLATPASSSTSISSLSSDCAASSSARWRTCCATHRSYAAAMTVFRSLGSSMPSALSTWRRSMRIVTACISAAVSRSRHATVAAATASSVGDSASSSDSVSSSSSASVSTPLSSLGLTSAAASCCVARCAADLPGAAPEASRGFALGMGAAFAFAAALDGAGAALDLSTGATPAAGVATALFVSLRTRARRAASFISTSTVALLPLSLLTSAVPFPEGSGDSASPSLTFPCLASLASVRTDTAPAAGCEGMSQCFSVKHPSFGQCSGRSESSAAFPLSSSTTRAVAAASLSPSRLPAGRDTDDVAPLSPFSTEGAALAAGLRVGLSVMRRAGSSRAPSARAVARRSSRRSSACRP
mmetsp:Transcript_7756/g.23729  ORF Transcript_7756/g.23729 Transcript_7756/m.23729 type:complete len:530 (-) Transcript_7756:649-2238(-)